MTDFVVTGALVGLVRSIALGRLLQSLLYGLSAHDPMVLATAVAVMVCVGGLASFWPAWRASLIR